MEISYRVTNHSSIHEPRKGKFTENNNIMEQVISSESYCNCVTQIMGKYQNAISVKEIPK